MVTEASAEMLQKLLLSERKIILCWIVVKKINGFILVLRFRRCYYTFLHLQVKGLMTIAPFVANPEENREVFQKLKKLSVDIAAKNINNVNMSVLSMGMTGDYQVAVQEGATMVRVGTGIFGERNYAV